MLYRLLSRLDRAIGRLLAKHSADRLQIGLDFMRVGRILSETTCALETKEYYCSSVKESDAQM